MGDHNFSTKHQIDFNLNVNFIHPGLMPILLQIKDIVMATSTKVDDLNAATAAAAEKIAALKDAQVDLTSDVATLVTGFSDVKTQLVNVAAELQALKDSQGDAIPPEALDSAISSLTNTAADAQTVLDSLKTTDASVEGATGVQTPPVGDGVPTGT